MATTTKSSKKPSRDTASASTRADAKKSTASPKRARGVHAGASRPGTQRSTGVKPIRPPRAAPINLDEPLVPEVADPREYIPETSIGTDPLSEALAEATVERATGGDDPEEDLRDQPVDEERGGPFVITTGSTEFAPGTDASNPPEALREPLPKV